MKHYEEMRDWVLPQVIAVNRAVTRPVIEKKTGLKVISEGKNFGEVVTNVDIGVSNALLNGGIPGVKGLRSRYAGSFSEEQDSPSRRESLAIYEVDPIDGTGDFQKTYTTDNVLSPTTLITKLVRDDIDEPFRPVVGMIFEIVNEYALIGGAGDRTRLFVARQDGRASEISTRPKDAGVLWNSNTPVRINRRHSYPQTVFDEEFPRFLREKGFVIEQIPTGGAGMQALQFFRGFIEPTAPGAESFVGLQPLNIVFNCQPDWKSWDTDPAKAISMSVRASVSSDVFGETLTANATATTMQGMWHRRGCVLQTFGQLAPLMMNLAREFQASGRDLLSINY